ncbi:MAG TPA: RagB/SusD family nutrient uptake outer membrane protein [Bacteroidales bacterium]|nr:RagB/SusD family nutrient uptake outer membrane protein [Bacteroidales bacterium]HPI69039.1 RagB/SusD family nutrient uptake outer membrane protein [Bacteroidales bacterium]
MKTKIITLLLGCLFVISCSEEFITKDFDKSRYVPDTFFNTQDHAIQALNAAYSVLNDFSNFAFTGGILHWVLGDDLYETGYAAGFGTWGPTSNLNITNTFGEVSAPWSGNYALALAANVALEVMPAAKEAADDPNFTQDVLDTYMGQAYFLRAFAYYKLFTYFPEDRIVLRRTPPKTQEDFNQAPAPADSIFKFIESDLKKAQNLLTDGLNTTAGYEPGRATRGSAAALLGKLYMWRDMYAEAAAEFKKILPGVGNADYGSYQLVSNYRDNFTIAGENNIESVFEIQFANITNTGFGNELNWITQQWGLNRTSWPDMWWNFAVPDFKLDGLGDTETPCQYFENWTETIGGEETTVYDYRTYQTFWGVPNGANFTFAGTELDWQEQGWDVETVVGLEGVFGIRKNSLDNSAEAPAGAGPLWSEVNLRHIRLADIMLLYAECLANLNPSNETATDPNSAVYWVDQVRDRANTPMIDQAHLYSARPGVDGQLPSATDLMADKGWTLMQLIEHERYVEGFCEGWRHEDLYRWRKGPDYVKYKSGWDGYQSLKLPVPQSELDNNPNMPR